MRRSLLFIPGNNPGMLQNANLFDADSVIFDLEDAVSVNEKDSARCLVKHYLEYITFDDLEVIIRINGLDTPFYNDDLEAVVTDKIDTLMVPKASYDDLYTLNHLLNKLESDRQLTKKIKLIPIVELATSLLEVEKIANFPRVDGILLGAEDLTSDMEVERTSEGDEILYARSKIALACKAAKIDAIDTPFTNTNAEDLLVKDCKRTQNLGMNAKACIHPNQIPTVNKVFSPSDKQIKYALRVLLAAQEAANNGIGVFSLDGKMVDKPIIARCEKVILKARKFRLIDDDK